MGYFADGFFTGFLCSVKETGRRLKNGAKELVEDFISGFNGHGWKLWKRGDSWRLELDELMVRKSFQVFELIINQITAIKGSQAITQGHAKIKDVAIIQEADAYQEERVIVYSEDYTAPKWELTVTSPNDAVITKEGITTTGGDVVVFKTRDAINETRVIVTGEITGEHFFFYKFKGEDGLWDEVQILSPGEYVLPKAVALPSDAPADEFNGFLVSVGTVGILTQIPLRDELVETIVKVPSYRIQIDDEYNSISEYDLVRCQKGDKFYYVQVGSVFQYYINIPLTEFESNEEGVVLNPPQAGDELVQFGNVSKQDKYKGRHSAIYLHVDEEEPAIDLMTDIYSKDWSVGNIIKTRLGGNLPGTNGDRGFYCVNGKLLFVDENGDTVSVINPDGSASFARGKLSWTSEGVPYFSGYVIAGDATGKRIEINPTKGSVEIYDDKSKLVNSIEGNYYPDIYDFFSNNIPKYTITSVPIQYTESTPSGGTVNTGYRWKLFEKPEIGIEVGEIPTIFYMSADIGCSFQNSSNGTGNAKLLVQVQRRSDSLYSTLLERTYNVDNAIIIDQMVINQLLPANDYYTIYVILRFNMTANSGQIVSSSLSVEKINAYFRRVEYKSSFFSRGLAFGDSPDNCAMIWYRKVGEYSGSIFAVMDSQNVGFKMIDDCVMIKSKPIANVTPPYCLIPHLILHAQVQSSGVYADACAFGYNYTPKVSKIGIGHFYLTWDKVPEFNITSNTYIYITPKYETQLVQGYAHWLNNKVIEIYTYNSAGLYDISVFYIDVYYLPGQGTQEKKPNEFYYPKTLQTRAKNNNGLIFDKDEEVESNN